MEHNEIQWLGAPSCQRGSFAFYKSVSSKSGTDGPVQVWKLGEFYFIRCGPQDPVCIAEVTLLWEDQTQRHLLASARLYFLPEDTPKGRTRQHGEDEVLAVSRKMVLRVEDLVKWSCSEPNSWINSSSKHQPAPAPPPLLLLPSCGTNGVHKPPQNNNTDNSCNNSNHNVLEKINQPMKDKTENGVSQKLKNGVKILSYPQYCRFRSLQRRIQDGAKGPGLQDPHLLALGGVKALPSTRLMYCRDTFSHPMLENSAGFSWEFRSPSLSLRGRPRKRRGRDGKDSPTSGQSESWIERMKENVMGSVEVGGESSWLPHPEEQLFLDQLYAFMDRHGAPIVKVPNLGFKKIDLFLMYSAVKRLGGYKKVTADRLWKLVYNELGGCPGSTSAATCTRKHYERLILPYDEHLRTGGTEFKIPESPSPPKPRGIRGRKPLQRGRKPGPKSKEKKMETTTAMLAPCPRPLSTPHSSAPPPPSVASAGPAPSFPLPRTIVNPNGPNVMVKRGRGRPPGARNKATLLTHAKVLTQQPLVKAKVPETPGLLIPKGRGAGGASLSSTHRPGILPITLPLTPDLSPMSTPFLTFQPKPKEMKVERAESAAAAPGMILSTLPRSFVGGSLSGFSPIKGMCPLDIFRNHISLQRVPESPALTPQDPAQRATPIIFSLQPKTSSTDSPQLQAPPAAPQPHHRCSGCNVDESSQRGVTCRDARIRAPLPPLRVLPLNLDCSVQVCQLMKARRLDSSQLQTFTRRLSEALSQDLSAKPTPTSFSPITPPPEQALPLNLSKRFVVKRPGTDGPEPNQAQSNGNADQQQQPPSAKRPRVENPTDMTQGVRSSSSTGSAASVNVETKNQEEPADLSSPSRIRAFLLGLPPFQVKLEEDLNGMRFGRFFPVGINDAPQRTEVEKPDGGATIKKDVTATAMAEEEAKAPAVVVVNLENNRVQKVEPEGNGSAHCSVPVPVELKLAPPSNTDTHCF